MSERPPVPKRVTAGGVGWTVQETPDEMLVFTHDGIPGFADVFMFHKADGYWKVAVTAPRGEVSAGTMCKLLGFCRVWRGDSWKPWWPRERYDRKTGRPLNDVYVNRHERHMAMIRFRSAAARKALEASAE